MVVRVRYIYMKPTQRNTSIVYLIQLHTTDELEGVQLSLSLLRSYVLCTHCRPPHAPQDTQAAFTVLPAAQRRGFLPVSQS